VSDGVAAFGKEFNADLCVRTLQSAAADRPDFYLNIGDDFSVDQLKTVNAELDLTCAGARELALALLSEADRADLVGRVGAGPAIGALN
jgi:hypothetical protein